MENKTKYKIFVLVLLVILLCGVTYFFFDSEVANFNKNKYVVLFAFVATVIGTFVAIINSITKDSSSTSFVTNDSDKTRHQLTMLLDRVEHYWVKGVLEDSIHHAAFIELGKKFQTTEVNHPWERVLELPDRSNQVLPAKTTIAQVFKEDATRFLLILGEPGSGKTTTIIELAKELIAQVREDKERVIPVVFNLSSWATQQKKLPLWLVDELNNKYQIPKEIGESWLNQQLLLPLLDGLDEVRADVRANCVKEINEFAIDAGITGLVVCCRTEEYRELPKKLDLNAAVSLQPLELEQVNDYIESASENLAGLSKLLMQDNEMQALAKSPLMLSIMSLAYKNVSIEDATRIISCEDKRSQLFDRYIEKMFSRRRTEQKRFSDEQVIKVLAWLAKQMQQRDQSIFLVDNLQPDWLPLKRNYALSIGIFTFLIGILLSTLGTILPFVELNESYFFLFSMCVVNSIGWSYFFSSDIHTLEILNWSWNEARKTWVNNFIYLSGMFVIWFSITLVLLHFFDQVTFDKIFFLFVIYVVIFVMGWVINSGLTNQIPVKKNTINQGIVSSFQNMVRIGIPYGLLLGVITVLIFSSIPGYLISIEFILTYIIIGILGGMAFLGGIPVFQHYTLRLVLFINQYTPFDFVGLLNYSVRLILLRRIGGNYVFIHRLLLEHFAKKMH